MKPRVGSPAHRDLFCKTFIATHRVFEPESLPWPKLEPQHIELLRSLPFWSFAVSLEQEAGRMITEFAATIADPMVREAIELQAYEEARHGRLLRFMLAHYGINVPEVPISDKPVGRDDFLEFGFGECTDSFAGFGGFMIARRKGILPSAFLDIFEQVMFEEARHIVFFTNYWRYEEAIAGRTNAFARVLRAVRYQYKAVMHTAQGAQGSQTLDTGGLTGGGAAKVLEGVTPVDFIAAALQFNRDLTRRLDRRLLRPRLIPTLATIALYVLRALPPRQQDAAAKAPRLAA